MHFVCAERKSLPSTAATWPRSERPKQRQSGHRRQKACNISSEDIAMSSTLPHRGMLGSSNRLEYLLCRRWDISRVVDLATLNKTIISEGRNRPSSFLCLSSDLRQRFVSLIDGRGSLLCLVADRALLRLVAAGWSNLYLAAYQLCCAVIQA
jgi:hypothetical protein